MLDRNSFRRLLPAIGVLVIAGAFAAVAHWAEKTPPAVPANSDSRHLQFPAVRVSIDPTTSWQPRSGEIKIAIEDLTGDESSLASRPLTVHFRWHTTDASGVWYQTPSIRTVEIPNAKKVVIAAVVPELPPPPTSAFEGLWNNGNGVRTFLTLVPVADVWVTAEQSESPGPPVDQVLRMGITTWWVAAVAAVGAVAALLTFLVRQAPRGLKGESILLKVIETRGAHASLSQFQIMLWTLLVGAAMAYVMAISGNLVPLTQSMVMMLGISGAAILGSSLAAPKPPDARDPSRKPMWRDLVEADGEIEVTRVQMLFFTVMMAVYVSIHVIDNYEIPTIPETFLTLMGLSNGVYLANKFIPTKEQAGASANPKG